MMNGRWGRREKERWVRWDILNRALGKMYLESFVYDTNGIEIVLECENENIAIRILFDSSVLAFRGSDEGRRLSTIIFLEENYGSAFYANWTFFKIDNSSYVQWFNEETYNIYSNYHIEHYVFLSADDIVEVLSIYPPTVTLI